MSAQNFMTFEAHFPDDAQWSAGGDLLVPGGKAVAEAIAAGLRARNLPVGEVEQHEWYGWGFSVERYSCVLQGSEHWLAIVEDNASVMKKTLRGAETSREFEVFLNTVHDVLTGDRRISDIHRYTRAEYERGGSA